MSKYLLVGMFVAILMTIYEFLKQFLAPDISIWESHVVTILFTTFLSVIAAILVSIRLEKLVRERTGKLNETNEKLEREVDERRNAERKQKELIHDLQKASEEVRQLSGLLPLCSHCKKIRDDQGYWNILESYIEKNSNASFSHGLCPDCSDKLYGDKNWYIKMKQNKKKPK